MRDTLDVFESVAVAGAYLAVWGKCALGREFRPLYTSESGRMAGSFEAWGALTSSACVRGKDNGNP